MLAVDYDEPGGPEVLKLKEINIPDISKDEVLIKVKSAGVNRPDIIQRQGNYPAPPGHSKILGLEVSGIIEKVGNNVKNFLVGDKVGALVNGGGYAEFCKADESSVFHVPKNISFNEAACIPECFFTAWSNLVMRGKLKKKQKILIHGGTSGVGIASIQIAKLFDSVAPEVKIISFISAPIRLAISDLAFSKSLIIDELCLVNCECGLLNFSEK